MRVIRDRGMERSGMLEVGNGGMNKEEGSHAL